MINSEEIEILRELAEEKRTIAELPVQKEHIENWTKLNKKQKCKPPILIFQIPWEEVSAGEKELDLKCKNRIAREMEWEMRTQIYQWKHIASDMVIDPVCKINIPVIAAGFGMSENSEVIKGNVNSRHFEPQIKCEADVEKIKTPVVSGIDTQKLAVWHEAADKIADILEIQECGLGAYWFAPWDVLITWYGIQEFMMDMVLKPELVHAAIGRLTDAYIAMLDQYEKLNLLSPCNGNDQVGSGGLGYTDELPRRDCNPAKVRTVDQWGSATAQIFSEVSPEMHEEFALRYERRWLEKFGMTYYGCCEPLHNKVKILRSIKNLRKISMSPWAKPDKMAEEAGTDYVLSYKPNPAIFARDEWDIKAAEAELRDTLDKTKGCSVEIILKDISTVRNQPRRLWEWGEMAKRVSEEYS